MEEVARLLLFLRSGGRNVELSAALRMVVERIGTWWRGIHKCGLNCGKVGEEIAETKSDLRETQVACGTLIHGACSYKR